MYISRVIRFHYKSRIYFSLRLIDGKKLLLGKLFKKKTIGKILTCV